MDGGCGCGERLDPGRLADFATQQMRVNGSTAEWTHCYRCGRPYTNRELLRVMLRRWGKLASTEAERIPIYAAMADVLRREGDSKNEKEALRSLVKAHEATGGTLAASEDMLVAFLRYGGKLFDCGNPKKAEDVFAHIMRHSGSEYAWTGAENLAELASRRGEHERSVGLLDHALSFSSLDDEGRARIEMRLATACMRTFRFSRALAIAQGANKGAWHAVAKVENSVAFVADSAAKEIARYAAAFHLV